MNRIKIAVGVIALIAAAAIFWMNSGGADPIPDTPESRTSWMCHACRQVFTLTAAEAAREEARAGGPSPLFCPACFEKEAYRVAQCETCGAYYFSSDVPGSSGRCETCYPEPPRERPKSDSPPSV